MRLNLRYQDDDPESVQGLQFYDHRRYVVRALVPSGYEAYFQTQARYISAHTSTAIEGNPMDDEAAMIVLVEGADAHNPNAVEKINLNEAYELMTQLASDTSTRIDQGIIRAMNSLVLRGSPDYEAQTRGKYRVRQNLIVDSATREVRYRPPPPEVVSELMVGFVEDLGSWIDEFPPPIAAALAHFGLISIHPFDNGNGRTARLLADMVLHQKGWSIDGMLSISKVILDDRAKYYNSLREAQGDLFAEDVDVTPFIRFHTETLGVAAALLEDKVVRFNKRRDYLMKGIPNLNSRQVTGLMFMLDIGPLSTSTYARLTSVSQPTALADLAQLIDWGIVAREGAGRNTRYRLHPRLVNTIEDSLKERSG